MTQVSLTVDLIGRLKITYPDLVMGVKDSGGDWTFTEALLATHGDLAILVGDERHLAAGVRLGAKGAISGLANVCPAALLPLVEHGENDYRTADLVNEVLKYPVTAAVKALIAWRRNDAGWSNCTAALNPHFQPRRTRARLGVRQDLFTGAALDRYLWDARVRKGIC